MSELRQVLRQLVRRPGTPLFAVFTLALGVAATASVYLVVRGTLLEELPYQEPDRLALVWRGTAENPDIRGSLSPGDWLDLRERVDAFEDLAAVNSYSTTLIGDEGVPEQITLAAVTGNLFGTLGLPILHGRGIGPDDDRPRQGPDDVGILVLDYGFWQARFAGDPGAVGRSVRLGGSLYTIVGVLRPEARLYMPQGSGVATDVVGWIPFDVGYDNQPRDGAYLRLIGRLAPGITFSRADTQLDAAASRLQSEHPVHAESGMRLRAEPLADEVVAHVRPILAVLSLAAVAVLLVACFNVTTLLLIRFLGRRIETAVKLALGAGRWRVAGLFLQESVLICFGGTALGLVLAGPAVRGLLALQPGIVPRTDTVVLDASVILPALAVAVGTTVLCGLGPALMSTFDRVTTLLRSRDSAQSGSARWVRRALLLVQVAASFALMYGGASLVSSLMRVRSADLGFDPGGAMTARVTLPFGSYRGTASWVTFFGALEDGLEALPGVASAGLTSDLPTQGDQSLEPWAPTEVAGAEPWGARTALHRVVSPGYFDAVGVPVREGRGLRPSDAGSDASVVVVDRTLARALAADGGGVVGRLIDITQHSFESGYEVGRRRAQVVGVVDDVPHEHPEARPPGTVYAPHAQYPLWAMSMVVRGAGGDPPDGTGLREAVAGLDPGLPVTQLRTLDVVVSQTMATTRFLLALVTGLAIVVVGLTAAGLFGLVSETVLQRRRELGIRMALGARQERVVALVALGGVAIVLAGFVPGLVAVPWVGRALQEAVGYGPVWDLFALGTAMVSVASVAILACYLPARRAAAIRPAVTLREQ